MTDHSLSEPGLALRLAQGLHGVSKLPDHAQRHLALTLLNVMGCALAGARHPSSAMARRALLLPLGAGPAHCIGHAQACDAFQAAALNAMAAAVHSFDDTHADALVHPGGPVGFALMALAHLRAVSGEEFLHAYGLGIEMACRLSKALSSAPAVAEPRWVQNGVATGAGAALACAKVLGLDAAGMATAVGIALASASGVRALSRSHCFSLMSGQAAAAGLRAALLAQQGFGEAPHVLEAEDGVLAMYAKQPHSPHLLNDLGVRFELMDNLCKPYPCGVVLHPAIDACLAAVTQGLNTHAIQSITLNVAPAAFNLANLPHPSTPEQAKMSLQHWVALSLLDGQCGLAQTDPARLLDARLLAMRARVQLQPDPQLERESATLDLRLEGGRHERVHIPHCRGSRRRPMTEDEVIQKFRGQCQGIVLPQDMAHLLESCLGMAQQAQAGDVVLQASRAYVH